MPLTCSRQRRRGCRRLNPETRGAESMPRTTEPGGRTGTRAPGSALAPHRTSTQHKDTRCPQTADRCGVERYGRPVRETSATFRLTFPPFCLELSGLSLRPDEKLLKVPGDVRPVDGTPNQKLGVLHEGGGVIIRIGELVFEVGKDWMCACPVDVTLLKDCEAGLKAAARTNMLQGIQDLTIAAVLLQNRAQAFRMVSQSEPSLPFSSSRAAFSR
ncbi:hypothetical protein EYF80_002477 [Liparis tanakae]|uniref:Uncharacterized protein n=1 Tax=Liparis tanakae TaxID=230148 RepID=A0A4Z2JAA1_9TELE|nr:hypothetical protein EYF80_002477 [Liparis tanakae]